MANYNCAVPSGVDTGGLDYGMDAPNDYHRDCQVRSGVDLGGTEYGMPAPNDYHRDASPPEGAEVGLQHFGVFQPVEPQFNFGIILQLGGQTCTYIRQYPLYPRIAVD